MFNGTSESEENLGSQFVSSRSGTVRERVSAFHGQPPNTIRDLAPLEEEHDDLKEAEEPRDQTKRLKREPEPGSIDWTRSQSMKISQRGSAAFKMKGQKEKKRKRAKSMRKKSKKSSKVPAGLINENSWHRNRKSYKR